MVNSNQIQEITSEGIRYIDDDGTQRFIDFMECFNTWVKWERTAPVTTQRQIESAIRSKQVGEINYLGELSDDGEWSPPYVVFHDNRVTVIEFTGQEECGEFHQRILDLGWGLFDLSD